MNSLKTIAFSIALVCSSQCFGQLTNEQLESLFQRGREAVPQDERDVLRIAELQSEISEEMGAIIPLPMPKLYKPKPNPKIKNLAVRNNRLDEETKKAQKEYDLAMEEYKRESERFEDGKKQRIDALERKISEIRRNIQAKKMKDWYFPGINTLDVKPGTVGMVYLSRKPKERDSETFVQLEFYGTRNGSKTSSQIRSAFNVFILDGVSNEGKARHAPIRIGRPVVALEPTEPERFARLRVLTDRELTQVKDYLESKGFSVSEKAMIADGEQFTPTP